MPVRPQGGAGGGLRWHPASRNCAMSSVRHVALLASALMLATSHAAAHDDGHEWPEGSAMHSMQLESARLDAGLAALQQAHAGLMGAMGENTARGPSALSQALAVHHEAWLAYTRADCELAGTLTGAGSSWPTVHGLGCHAGAVEERVEVLRGATACLQQLDADITDFDRLECLQGLVARSMQPD